MQRYRMVALCLLLMAFLAGTAALAQESTPEPTTDDPGPEITVVPEPIAEVTIEPVPDANARPVTQQGDAEPTTVVEAGAGTYTVQPGDNLYRIALRFGTTSAALAQLNGIANPRLIIVGQVLTVPGSDDAPDQPAPTEEPGDPPTDPTGNYTVQAGDNLYRIAIRFGTTVSELQTLNSIANSNIIFVGQVLNVPGGDTSATPDDDSDADMDADTGTDPSPDTDTDAPPSTLADPGFDYGVIAYQQGQDFSQVATQVDALGVNWVKIYADWSAMEATQGTINIDGLSATVGALDATGVNIMITVVNAPDWSRSVTGDIIENGPPDDLSHFETFMTSLVSEFAGIADAYQIWDEPNLRRNWRCDLNGRPGMCNTDYMEMLSIANTVVNTNAPDAWVVSAGLAPTRFNDRVNAIDDRLFLETLVANNLADVADAVGIHPGGFANPPDAECCDQISGVETHYEDASFYFLENLNTYRSILGNGGAGDLPLWVTRFGWGTSEDTDPPGEINIYVTYTSLGQQAIYAPRAFEVGEELGYVGVMFLDNLNGCQINASRAEICYTSLIAPDGTLRPVYEAVQAINGDTTAAPAPATDTEDMAEDEPAMEDTMEADAMSEEATEEAAEEAVPQGEG